MRAVTSTEFRNNAASVLDEVEKGETVEISRHGRVIARMIPAATGRGAPSWKSPGLSLAVKGWSLSRTILRERRGSR